jgi:hypothetical protein
MIESFATGSYSVVRAIADGEYVEGVYQPPLTQTISVSGSLQPLSPKESLLLPETERNKESFSFFSDAELFPASESGLRPADIVLVDSIKFLVRSVSRWQGVDLPYFKSLLQRVNEQGGGS